MRINMDIYAIVEATQELHFGNVKDLNVNRIELVTVPTLDGEIEKLYMSPTKVRGVARRALMWKLNDLGDEQIKSCGIPATCGKCDLCKLFGGLMTTSGADEGSIASRVFQAGGVAIQEISPDIKQRLCSPSYILEGQIGQYDKEKIKNLLKNKGINEKDLERLSTPMPYEKEYVEASALFPIYWHSLLLETEKGDRKLSEPQMVAYSFLESLKRIGAGHPKGADIFHYSWDGKGRDEPLLVVDIYTEPLGKRPIISPMITDAKKAINEFIEKANLTQTKDGKFERYKGDNAESLLRCLASGEPTSSILLKSSETSASTINNKK
ncbi:hypothetical protein Mtc_1190 [Methanocella conradii HZ254]|uniref:Uncharacterized protein n=1 Tax=Methanocella conradii (strain DSM 24694 / JCM 17849 / CGMCC 1.5162 / HZ254) TaxID=1041930 RepID=H8I8N9_METCZ|nr:hypothetical protein [Methanocella conradii]AFC99943.1 hypothetical protein Mtc_1190 [Methanocella conradii HZ254]